MEDDLDARYGVTPVKPGPFFVATYLLSWGIWIPLVLSKYELWPIQVPDGVSNLVRLVGVLAPAVCALALTARAGGRSAANDLLRRLALWRVGWWWWAAAVLLQPILIVASALIYNSLRPAAPVTPVPFASIGALVTTIVFLAIASVGEELGWRGVALPGLQARRTPLTSSVILGLLWAVWHLPFWILVGTLESSAAALLGVSVLGAIPLSVFVTWLFNHTRFSILIAVVFHLAFNLVNAAWLPVGGTPAAFFVLVALEWACAAVLIPRLGRPPGAG